MASEWNGSKPKWQTPAGWTPEVVPTNEIDALFTAAHVANCAIENAERACRSLMMTGYTGTLTMTGFPLKVGSGVAQAENIAIKVPATATISGQRLDFVGTVTATAQTISIASALKTELRFSKSGKYQLGENLTSAVTEKLRLEAGTLELNAKTLDMGAVEVSGTPTLDTTNATIKLREVGMVWLFPATGTLTSTGSTMEVLSPSATEKTFSGGGKSYATVSLTGSFITVAGSNSYTAHNIGAKGAAEGKGIRWTVGTIQTCTALDLLGTEGSPSRLESTKAAEQAKLVLPVGGYQTNGFGVVKDIDASGGGTWYVPNATVIENSPNVKKEEKPISGALPLVMLV